jgi:Phage integrase, N-terminal SAM-like domain
MIRTGATFADAAAEYLRWIEHDRARKPSTVRDSQSIINAHLLPAFGTKRLEDITTEGVERWAAGLTAGGLMNNRTKLKILTVLHGVMGRAPGMEAPAQPGCRATTPPPSRPPTRSSSPPR